MENKLTSKLLLLFVFFIFSNSYGQTDSALRYRLASMTFEDAVAAHMAMLDTSGSDTSEGGRGNAFTRWYMWADNRRSICPVGEDIFAPLGRELMHYLTTPTGYCAAMSQLGVVSDYCCPGKLMPEKRGRR